MVRTRNRLVGNNAYRVCIYIAYMYNHHLFYVDMVWTTCKRSVGNHAYRGVYLYSLCTKPSFNLMIRNVLWVSTLETISTCEKH